MNKKKKHRKLNKKRVFTLLIFLLSIIVFIIFLLNLRVKNILIVGNTYIKDSEIIRACNLKDYPYYKDINKKSLENTINDIPLLNKTKVTKKLNGTLKITVEEEKPLLYLNDPSKIITDQNNTYENINLDIISMPTLKNNISEETKKILVTALSKVKTNLLEMISEIEYTPTISQNGTIIDDKRFTFYMNDSNIAVVNAINIDKFNNYLKIVSKTMDSFDPSVKGTYNFDSGTSNVFFSKFSSEDDLSEEF